MNEVTVHRVALILTLRCNLKCKLCAAYAPYYFPSPPHFPLPKIKNTIKNFFDFVDNVGKLSVSGGEPLMHEDLNEIIEYLMNYKNRIDVIEVITNGTIVPSDELLDICAQIPNIYFLLDNYGSNLSKAISAIENKLSAHKIAFVTRNNNESDAHCNGWVDYSDLKEQQLYSQEDIESRFRQCAFVSKMGICFGIYGDYLHLCGRSYRHMEITNVHNDSECLNINDDTYSISDKKLQVKNMYSLKSLSACAFCSGLCDDSERFPPAEQLTSDELKEIHARGENEFKV